MNPESKCPLCNQSSYVIENGVLRCRNCDSKPAESLFDLIEDIDGRLKKLNDNMFRSMVKGLSKAVQADVDKYRTIKITEDDGEVREIQTLTYCKMNCGRFVDKDGSGDICSTCLEITSNDY